MTTDRNTHFLDIYIPPLVPKEAKTAVLYHLFSQVLSKKEPFLLEIYLPQLS
jgi:hypothetical protein